jgi:hypothetical protein
VLNSSNQWSLYFDGSDVDPTRNTEDIWALWINEGGDLYLNTQAKFSAGGVSGDGNDVFACTPAELGENSVCSLAVFLSEEYRNTAI